METMTAFLIVTSILLIITGATVCLFALREKGKGKAAIEVPLNDLAQIWLKYNNDVIAVNETTDGVEALYSKKSDEEDGEKEEERSPAPPKAPIQGSVLIGLIERLKPYEGIFTAQNADGLFKALIGELDCFGHCPSVVTRANDSEAVELYSVRDNLSRVSLKEHSVGVTNRIISLLERTYHDFENHIPRAVIAALSHDLGKIPEYWASGAYNTYEHPLVSAAKLKELAGNAQIPWIEDAIRAVKDHHIHTNNQFSALLKEADKGARELELLRFSGELSVMPMEQWLDPAKLVKLLEPQVNALKNGKWQAFTFGGIVYSTPGFLYEQAKILCRQAKALDLTVIYESEKEVALRRITGILRQAEYIPDLLQQNYYARKVEIAAVGGKKRFILTPLKGEHFNLQELESRKTGYLSSIREVKYI